MTTADLVFNYPSTANGSVRVTLPRVLDEDSDEVYPQRRVSVTITSGTGAGPEIRPVNDAGLNPQGAPIKIEEFLSDSWSLGSRPVTYWISPTVSDISGGEIDVAALTPVPGVDGTPNLQGPPGPAGPDTLEALDTLFLTPERFGAAGNGIADDLEAWQDLAAAITAQGGGHIIANGQYRLTDSVNLDGDRVTLELGPNAHIFCDQPSTYGHTIGFIGNGLLGTATSPVRGYAAVIGTGKISGYRDGGVTDGNENAVGFVRYDTVRARGFTVPEAGNKAVTSQYGCRDVAYEDLHAGDIGFRAFTIEDQGAAVRGRGRNLAVDTVGDSAVLFAGADLSVEDVTVGEAFVDTPGATGGAVHVNTTGTLDRVLVENVAVADAHDGKGVVVSACSGTATVRDVRVDAAAGVDVNFFNCTGRNLAENITGPAGVTGTISYTGTSTEPAPPIFLDPRDYGALFDGTTDDTAAIQAAIDDAEQDDWSGVVKCPAGTAIITGLTFPSTGRIRLEGAGRDSTMLRLADTADLSAITVHGVGGVDPNPYARGWAIADLTIRGGATQSASQVGLDLLLASDYEVTNVILDRIGTGVLDEATWRSQFTNTYATSCGTGWKMPTTAYATSSPKSYTLCSALACDVGVDIDDKVNNLVWTGGDITGNDLGVSIDGTETRSITFTGVSFERNVNEDVMLGASAAPANVTFIGCGFLRTSIGAVSVQVVTGSNTTLTACRWTNYTKAIDVDSGAGVVTITAPGTATVTTFLTMNATNYTAAPYFVSGTTAAHYVLSSTASRHPGQIIGLAGAAVSGGNLIVGASNRIEWGSGGPIDGVCTGTPEGAVTADVGSTMKRIDGGAGTSFYVKESGTGNTGWVPK